MAKIIADTTCGLPPKVLSDLGITCIPQIVVIGDQSYRDDTELDTAAFLDKLKAARSLPKTAAPPPALYYPAFEQAQASGEELVVIAPSARLSGTVRSAETAAQEFPRLKLHVVDTRSIAGNLASLVLLGNRWAGEGLSAAEIVARLEQWIPRQQTYFMVATLEYLQKGGRIGGAKALLGELLQVKPILCLREGQVEPFEQQRTKKRALNRLVEIVEAQCPRQDEAHLCVLQADAEADASALVDLLQSRMQLKHIPVYQLPPAIVVHGGPGVMGVAFFGEFGPMV
jgi:DegV family protein with EDD domain